MDTNNKPHSRDKEVAQGTASGVGKGEQVSTNGPVGNGTRPQNASQGKPPVGSRPVSGPASQKGQSDVNRDSSLLGALMSGMAQQAAQNQNSQNQQQFQQTQQTQFTPVQSGVTPVTQGNGASTAGKASPLRKLLMIILLVIVVIFIYKSCFAGSTGYQDYYDSGDNSTSVSDTSSSSGLFGSSALESLLSAAGSQYQYTVPSSDSTASSAVSNPAVSTSSSSVSTLVANEARDKRVKLLGGGKDTVTVMVYMCGTDLESKYGMATSDLVEMTKAQIADNVNVIVETGGCSKWQNNIVSNKKNQIYQVTSGGISKLAESDRVSMVNPDNLTSFIQYCTKNYPANRNILILWDHGGGSITGYGYDETASKTDSMTLTEINSALKKAGCVFDWIGFDACLMATTETALVCNNYADYMIASEEAEPGEGWYYTNWLTDLSKNTSISTLDLGKTICDDFVRTSLKSMSSAQVSLSLTDLAELQGTLPGALSSFSTGTTSLLNSNNYSTVSNARSKARQFAASNYLNQIDLADFANKVGTPEGKALANAIRSCVKYNKTNISNAYGLSIYFPYETTQNMNAAVNTYNELGFSDEYTACIRSFASLMSSGQIVSSGSGLFGLDSLFGSLGSGYGSGGSSSFGSYDGYSGYSSGGSYGGIDIGSLLGGGSSPLGSLTGNYSNSSGYYSAGSSMGASDILSLLSAFSGAAGNKSLPASHDWVDADTVDSGIGYVAENCIDPGDIYVTERPDGRYVLRLTPDQWNLIQTVELNVFVDDGEGYVDLGRDNVFEFDGNDLILDYDNTWLTLNGQVCAYYLTSDYEEDNGSWTTKGYIPAMLTTTDAHGDRVTQRVELNVLFNDDNPSGIISGATPVYEEGEAETLAKGGIQLRDGDVLQLLCDYYDYDGNYSASYELGDAIFVDDSGLELVNMNLGDTLCSVCWRLTDIYCSRYWTPAIIF